VLRCFILVLLFPVIAVSLDAYCQSLEGRTYDPEVDSDIDMYMNNWRESRPFHTHGSLVERDVLFRGNPADPERKGTVLNYVNRFTHASLYARFSTSETTLSGEQEILYILSGKGVIKSRETTADLYTGIFVLVPDGCTFTMTNTGDDPLNMYLISEPVVRSDFIPQKDIVVVDEGTEPIENSHGHWSMIIKQAFNINKELSIIEYVNAIVFDPMTIGHPHSHFEGCEEVWTSVEGTSILFLGKQIRMQTPGTAYMIPPDGNTPHSNINHTDRPIKLLYFAVRADWEENDGIIRTRK